VAGDAAVSRIRREPNPAIIRMVEGWPETFLGEPGRGARLPGRAQLRRDRPRLCRRRARRPARGLSGLLSADCVREGLRGLADLTAARQHGDPEQLQPFVLRRRRLRRLGARRGRSLRFGLRFGLGGLGLRLRPGRSALAASGLAPSALAASGFAAGRAGGVRAATFSAFGSASRRPCAPGRAAAAAGRARRDRTRGGRRARNRARRLRPHRQGADGRVRGRERRGGGRRVAGQAAGPDSAWVSADGTGGAAPLRAGVDAGAAGAAPGAAGVVAITRTGFVPARGGTPSLMSGRSSGPTFTFASLARDGPEGMSRFAPITRAPSPTAPRPASAQNRGPCQRSLAGDGFAAGGVGRRSGSSGAVTSMEGLSGLLITVRLRIGRQHVEASSPPW
jgi:hypothetical protein